MGSLLSNVDVLVLDAEMRLYRVCVGSADGVALDSFRSHYELKRPPRGPENRATMIHMALSTFAAPEPCWSLIDRTRQKIRDRVVELRLLPGRGIYVAKTASLVRLGSAGGFAGRRNAYGQVDVADTVDDDRDLLDLRQHGKSRRRLRRPR